MPTDVTSNRNAKKWSGSEQIGRIFWSFATPLFRFSPRIMWGWRRMILRTFGAKVGLNAHIYPSVRITIPWHIEIGDHAAIGDRVILYALGEIRIGARATVSQYAHLCAGTHDWRKLDMPLIKAPLVVCEDAWVCADAFVGPGVTIGESAIVGARAVTMKDVEPRTIVGGNPAQKIGNRDC
jgi:putative colanic acid biosynthesis acetyltransferase WcaF